MTTRNLASTPEFRPLGVSPFAGDVDGVLIDLMRHAAKDKAFLASLSQSSTSLIPQEQDQRIPDPQPISEMQPQ